MEMPIKQMMPKNITESGSDFETEDEMDSKFDDMCYRLKDGLDLKALRNPSGDGVDFELDEEDIERVKELRKEEGAYFDTEEKFAALASANVGSWITLGGGDSDTDSSNTEVDEDGEQNEMGVFKKLSRKMEDLPNSEKKVKKMLLKEGTGSKIPAGALVTVHYNAFTEYADEPYDSSRARAQPLSFKLATTSSETVIGFDLAVKSMKKGELSRFLVHPDLAYGKKGVPPRIPENATIMFEIEVINWVDASSVLAYERLSYSERREAPFRELLKYVRAQGEFGKKYFLAGQFRKAESRYFKAIRVLNKRLIKDEEEEKQTHKELTRFNVNSAVCSIKQGRYHDVLKNCKEVFELGFKNVDRKQWTKALYFSGKACHRLGDYQQARVKLNKARDFQPHDGEINEELRLLNISVKKMKELEKETCLRMFSKDKKGDNSESQTENKKEAEKQEDSKSESPSAEFQKRVEDMLIEFMNDDSQNSIPFPSGRLNTVEIQFIVMTADSYGFIIDQRGEPPNMTVTLRKPKK